MSRSHVRRFGALAVVILIVAVRGVSAVAQHGAFSMSVTFPASPAPGEPGIWADGYGVYRDYGDPAGRTPSVYGDGNIVLDLRGSSRLLCLSFDTANPTTTFNATLPLPVPNCFPVLLQTLIRADIGGITDMPPNTTNDFSVVCYWTGMGTDGKAHDYNFAFRRQNGNGVQATAIGTGTTTTEWKVESLYDAGGPLPGRVSIYLTGAGKNGGWTELADFTVPLQFDAGRQIPNLRGGKK